MRIINHFWYYTKGYAAIIIVALILLFKKQKQISLYKTST